MSKRIFLLGPCHKLNRKTGDLYPAFDIASRSGKFLRNIIASEGTDSFELIYGNILSVAWYNSAGSECLPTVSELVQPLKHHEVWVRADLIVGFGSLVREALERVVSDRTQLESAKPLPELIYLPHPSYVLRRPSSERHAFYRTLREIIYA